MKSLIPPKVWPWRFERIIQSWDTANKRHELADYSVRATGGSSGRTPTSSTSSADGLRSPSSSAAIGQDSLLSPEVVLIEDRASGTQLIQAVREGRLVRDALRAGGRQVMRLYAQTAAIENGFVWLPGEASWLAEYLRELIVFPTGRHDAGARMEEKPPAGAGTDRALRMMAEEEAGGGFGGTR
jgi:phage terminase large subunit-like protein